MFGLLDWMFHDPNYILAIEPFTALALFGAATNVIFGISSGNKAKRAREEQARVEAANAARAADRMLEEDLPVMMGRQGSAIAKSGAKLEGSPFAVMMDTARRMTRDAGDIRSRGIQQAQYLRQQGRVERESAILGGITQGIGAGINAAANQASFNRSQGTGSGAPATIPSVDRNFYMPSNSLGARGGR